MTLPRFSVRELLGFVTFLAVGTTALLYAAPAWAAILGALALGVLFLSGLKIALASGASRGFWFGVALFANGLTSRS